MVSYPKIYNLGHRCLEELFSGEVQIEEKIDGSQFSFGKTIDGIVWYRSKGRELFPPVTDELFRGAVEYVHGIHDRLVRGFTYRGEVLSRPKHNALMYDRVPRHNIIIFDIDKGWENYLSYEEKRQCAERLDLEVVPLFYRGCIKELAEIMPLLNNRPILGGAKIEGVVIKNYGKFGPDKKTIMGKWVRDEFKELAKLHQKALNPGQGAVIQALITRYRTEQRWEKAIQHLQENGVLNNDPRDIGPLIKEVNQDILTECRYEIKEYLFKWAWKKISRGLCKGLAAWYKNKLLAAQPIGEKHESTKDLIS